MEEKTIRIITTGGTFDKHYDAVKGELTFRQKVKYAFIDTWLLGPMYFCYSYFYKLGFLDGEIGFIYAAYKMQYFFNVKAKIEEIRMNG